jgi:hypothetical protein
VPPDHPSAPPIEISPSGRLDLPVPHGLLEALLREPSQPRRAAVVCHPHPQAGGTMNNNVVYRVARALERHDSAVLRFNFRGVGRSTGSYGEGVAECEDAQAALDFMSQRHPRVPLWMAGFSFGARVGLLTGIKDARVSKLLGVGLAVRMFDLSFLEGAREGKPLAVIQGSNDEYGGREEIEALMARLAEPKRLWVVEGASHLFPGQLDELEQAATEAIDWLETTGAEVSRG